MSEEAQGYLEVMSGPEDGEMLAVKEPVVLVGPAPGALLSLAYDPTVPEEGMCIAFSEDRVQIGDDRQVSFGELFRVGQVWMRFVLPTKGVLDDQPSGGRRTLGKDEPAPGRAE